MKRILKIFLITLVYVAQVASANAQNPFLLKGNFSQTTFKDFFGSVNAQTGLTIFYNPSDVDSLVVDVMADGKTLSHVLDELFQGTNLYYGYDGQGNLFITNGHYIQDRLPEDFFGKSEMQNQSLSTEDILAISGPNRANRIEIVGRIDKDRRSGNASVRGRISTVEGEPVVGATVYCVELDRGVVTNESGEYSISLPKGRYRIRLSAVGMKSREQQVAIYGDGSLNLAMEEEVKILSEVVVESERDINIKGIQMGVQKLDMEMMKKVAAVMGEVDVLRVMLALPGVQTVGEASTGLNVRGGSASQNLILYNNAVVYNPTHLFGFFTAFNPDEIGNTELIKSGIPAEKGGRLSSVININSRTGNKEKFVGHGGIGPLTSKLTLEAPIIKGRTSFVAGGRSSYSNWLLKKVPDDAISNSRASFYDVNFNVSHEHNERNNFFLSGYFSNDRFKFNEDTLYNYTNRMVSLSWNHVFSDKLNGNFVVSNSDYGYELSSTQDKIRAFNMSFGISQSDLKAELSFTPKERHNIIFGANSTFYNVRPGTMAPLGDSSLILYDRLQDERALENAVFIGDNFEINPKLSVYGGLRYSFYVALGPRDVYFYASGVPKSEESIRDTVEVRGFQSAGFYHGPEYRLSGRYVITNELSVKASYNLMRQYLQILSNTTSISPTDVWKLSDTHIKPLIGHQYSVGIYKNFRGGLYETSVEGYYKQMRNMIDYKDGADLLLNHTIEADVVNASGVAYGLEFLIKRSRGKLTGWLSYAYSRSFLRTSSEFTSETVNNGAYYPSNYDKPHAVNLIANYELSHRFSVSINSTYSTGRPITLPLAKYELSDALRLLYSERNQYRVPDYFRIDVAVNVEGNHKIKKLAHSSWTFGIYNLTARKNIYSVFFKSDGAFIKGYKLSVFGTPIPSITYNFRF